MIDDEFQLPVLAARYLADSAVPVERKRAFLLSRDGRPDAARRLLLRELALVAELTRALRARPSTDEPGELSASATRPTGARPAGATATPATPAAGSRWTSTPSGCRKRWRRSATILAALPALGLNQAALDTLVPGLRDGPLGRYVRDSVALRRAVETWRGARRHFEVALGPGEMGQRLRAKLAWLPAEERGYWEQVLRRAGEPRDTLRFLALSLDAEGRPIPVVNTDPATGLFLGAFTSSAELDQFVRPYPVALFAEGLGPLVANDAYASPAIWERFRKDTYHGPRVVWGREVNLLLLALAIRVGEGADPDGRFAGALRKTLAAVHASGLEHTELWSYRIEGGRLRAHSLRHRLRHPALERDRSRRPVRAGEAERLGHPRLRPATVRALKCSARLGACRVSRRSPLAECPARWP